ncbi:CoA transferase [Hoeflea prorocentri]|uniref:CoA transferase n=1 Tax=Hoeflea prorocentri TaxID=1922333 RepID=A0A9X3UJ16_9HYPH|nr:CoA transferase [Hoeflea prorocentri]MCY6381743.1 CoA transferase [Hoeflea prorocentri]MDA5399543.1 CoA transferase [Hoeflea prorocentri]
MTLPLLKEIRAAFPQTDLQDITTSAEGELPSCFAVSDLSVATVGMAGLKLAQFAAGDTAAPAVTVDRRLASFWFDMTLRPQGWTIPSPWDPIAGDYRAKDGWIRLHTNAPHHRNAALHILGTGSDREAVGRAVQSWTAGDLEAAVIEAGGCAAEMRSLEDWGAHPQGKAIADEPLIIWQSRNGERTNRQPIPAARPLDGLRILDLTRVLAGPVASRFLAAYGADVLRIDPPEWDEPGVVPEVTLGKRCAELDLKSRACRMVFEGLLGEADVLLHGYRPGALPNLGYDSRTLTRINPALIDVSLSAYGWSGPWSARRGFDSLVQMSCGIAHHGMTVSGADRPIPLPVQALDHATGYLLAAAVLQALDTRARSGEICSARLSLARVAHLLSRTRRPAISGSIEPETRDDIDPRTEATHWGDAKRIRFPLTIEGIDHDWEYPAGALRSTKPGWR